MKVIKKHCKIGEYLMFRSGLRAIKQYEEHIKTCPACKKANA